MDRKRQINGLYLIAAMLAVLAIQHPWLESRQVETIAYSQFEEMLDAGKIQDVRVGDKYITGTLKEVPPDGRRRFVTVRVEPMLAKRLAEGGVTVTGAVENNLLHGSCPFCSSSASGPSSSAALPRSREWAV
jgi:cell division protease FtsH